jgi:hypothetical protein
LTNQKENSKSPPAARALSDAEAKSESLGKASFPASDSPAVWIWEVPKVEKAASPPRREGS